MLMSVKIKAYTILKPSYNAGVLEIEEVLLSCVSEKQNDKLERESSRLDHGTVHNIKQNIFNFKFFWLKDFNCWLIFSPVGVSIPLFT